MLKEQDYHDAVTALLSQPPSRGNYPFVKPYEAATMEGEHRPASICYAHVDYGDALANSVANAFKLSASVVYPGYGLLHVPFECEKAYISLVRWQVFAKMRRGVRGNLMFLDSDIICNRACDPWGDDFDVGLTTSGDAKALMPFNAGVMFVKDTPAGQMFVDAVMEFTNNFPDASRASWFLDQVGIYSAYMLLKDKIKIKIFPHELYNYSPNAVEDTDAYFVHLKGPRKSMYVDFLRYAMLRHGRSEVVALPAEKITMTQPIADTSAFPVLKANIDSNVARGLPAWRADRPSSGSKVAIVGYGPSLAETWQQLKDFDGEIWTTSKAHDFLLSRGITPHVHVELDYREHKAHFLKLPSPTTRYVLATQVHPKYVDLLLARERGPVEFFHSNIPGGPPSGLDYYKASPEHDVGAEAAWLAYKSGFTDQTWFGMDLSATGEGTHAGPHGGFVSERLDILVGDRVFVSSALMVRSALFAEALLSRYLKLKVKITGDGMLRPFLQLRGKAKVN